MQPVQDSTKSHNELPPPVERHGRTFSPSVRSSHYGTRVIESMDNYTTFHFTWCLLRRKGVIGQVEMTLRLPGEFTEKYTVDAHTNLDNYSDKLRVAMSRLRLCPLRDTHQKNIFQCKEIDTCKHVFLRRIAIAPPLTAPYDAPYKVMVRSGRVMRILIKGKVETVSLDRVKPAHFECEPATGTITQRTMPLKRTSSKTTGMVRRNSQDPLTPSSTHTQRSNRTSVEPTTTKSKATKHGTNLATAPQQKAVRVKLPNKFKPYVAPHSRTPAVSRF